MNITLTKISKISIVLVIVISYIFVFAWAATSPTKWFPWNMIFGNMDSELVTGLKAAAVYLAWIFIQSYAAAQMLTWVFDDELTEEIINTV